MTHAPVAIGVTVKSGWACVVVLAEPVVSPTVVQSQRIDLSDPDVADARQPYHDGFGTARAEGRQLTRLIAGVKRFGGRSVTEVIRRARKAARVNGIGIVVGSLVDPATLGNSHVRIHALEGQLFRGVVSDAARRARLPATIWRERDMVANAVRALRMTDRTIRERLKALGRTTHGPWRAEQKAAALAAWLVLAQRTST